MYSHSHLTSLQVSIITPLLNCHGHADCHVPRVNRSFLSHGLPSRHKTLQPMYPNTECKHRTCADEIAHRLQIHQLQLSVIYSTTGAITAHTPTRSLTIFTITGFSSALTTLT
jgi:hypothetical protein